MEVASLLSVWVIPFQTIGVCTVCVIILVFWNPGLYMLGQQRSCCFKAHSVSNVLWWLPRTSGVILEQIQNISKINVFPTFARRWQPLSKLLKCFQSMRSKKWCSGPGTWGRTELWHLFWNEHNQLNIIILTSLWCRGQTILIIKDLYQFPIPF